MLRSIGAVERVSRVAFSRDVAAFPDWCWQTGVNRWDDPMVARLDASQLPEIDAGTRDRTGFYRVLYTATSRIGAYQEKFQDFRAGSGPLSIAAGATHQAIVEDSDEFAQDEWSGYSAEPGWGAIPETSLAMLWVGDIEVDPPPPELADVEDIDSVQHLRGQILGTAIAISLKLDDLSLGHILGGCRSLTQYVSRLLFQAGVAGIHHRSTLGSPGAGAANLAFFESRAVLRTISSEPVTANDSALNQALEHLRIRKVGTRGFPI